MEDPYTDFDKWCTDPNYNDAGIVGFSAGRF